MATASYAVLIESMGAKDGGGSDGYIATVPALPGCMSDGETRAIAAENVEEAIQEWIAEARRLGRPIPPPSQHENYNWRDWRGPEPKP